MVQKRDLVLLSHLRQDARMGLTAMSRSSRVPVSTIHDRIKAYAGTLVQRNTALLNFGSLGYHTRVTLLLRPDVKHKDAVRDFLMKAICVNSLCRVNNGFDFCVDCVFKDMHALEEFLDRLEGSFTIKAKQVYFVIDDIKREQFLSDPALVELVQG